MSQLGRTLLTLAVVVSLSLVLAASAHAGTITVSTTLDELDGAPDATCSLREAVQTANNDAPSGGCTDTNEAVVADTIVLAGGEYNLTRVGVDNTNSTGDLDAVGDVTIQGAGSAATGIDGNGAVTGDRVLSGGVLTLSGLTVHDGFSMGGSDGGGVNAGVLNLTDVVVRDNQSSDSAGGIDSASATLVNSVVSDNTSPGAAGGLRVTGGTATLTGSVVSGNDSGIDGGGINAGNAVLTSSTVQGNTAVGSGGGLFATDNVNLTNSTVTSNTAATSGGGVVADEASFAGTMVSRNSTPGAGGGVSANLVDLTLNTVVSENTAGTSGGGISGDGSIVDSTIVRNKATVDGGGIFTDSGNLGLTKSTVAGNDALDDGGGVYFTSNLFLDVTNSTLSGNSANDSGGGIFTDEGVTNLRNATITRNVADSDSTAGGGGGGFVQSAGTTAVNVRNTILAGNADLSAGAPDCIGTLGSDGYNLFGSLAGPCTITGVTTGNITNPNPGLALLADNSGPTMTHALLPGSPAFNAGYPGSGGGQPCEMTDQRGLPRPAAGNCDIGAFEAQSAPSAPPATNAIEVTTTFDQLDGAPPCSLREAIHYANDDVTTGGCLDFDNTMGDADTIVLAGGAYDLTRAGSDDTNVLGDLDVTGNLTIQGAGSGATGIDGNALDRALDAPTLIPALNLSGLTVHDGSTPNDGGGIHMDDGTLTDVTVVGNQATGQGAGIDGDSINLTDSTVARNDAGDRGGGVAAGGTATLTGSTVEYNTAGNDGGGISSGDAVVLTNSDVSGNIADGAGADGGGIFTGAANLTNSEVSGNDSSASGGGMETSDATITDSTVTGNEAGGSGGGLNLTGGGTLTRSTVSDNETTGGAGGILALTGTTILTESTLIRNEATSGGGIASTTGNLTVTRSTVAGNDASNTGGGVVGSSPGTLGVTNSTVSGNEAGSSGGGIFTDDGTTSLRNATITRNVADFDAGGTAGSGGGMLDTGSATLFVRNTIVAGNSDLSAGAEAPDCSGTPASEGYNLFGNTSSCTVSGVLTGNITNPNPGLALLADNGGQTLTHALLGGSPALNAGYPGSGPGQPCEATDQRGQPRGGGAGVCDIGAFEVQGPAVPPAANPPVTTPTPAPTAAKKKCKKGRKLKKGKCVKKKRKKRK